MMAVPNILLNNGFQIPAIGLGTYQLTPEEIDDIIPFSIQCGYRHFDCAFIYENEKEIGKAIRSKIEDGTVRREDLFITSKLWNTFHRKERVVPACRKSLEDLGLDYLDLYLVHYPFAYKEDQSGLYPSTKEGYCEIDYLETWKGMEECVRLGLTRSIGLSNFNGEQIERLLSVAEVKPVTNQVEVHPLFNQKNLISFCKERNILVTAHSPFGSPKRPWAKPGDPMFLLDDPKLKAIGKKYRKSAGQVVLRYLLDIGTVPIPKSSNKDRIKENLNLFDFRLEEEDMKVVDSFNVDGRVCHAPGMEGHKYYPFN